MCSLLVVKPAQVAVPGWAECVSSATTSSSVGGGGGLVSDDRGEVVLAEAAGLGGGGQGCLDSRGADESGELECRGHPGADAPRPGGRGGDQPVVGTLAEVEEVALGGAAGPWPRQARRPAGVLRMIGVGARSIRGVPGVESR